MRGIADSSTTKLRSLPPSSCINCLCATTTAAETTTDDFVGSPMPSEFPDTLKQSLGPRKKRQKKIDGKPSAWERGGRSRFRYPFAPSACVDARAVTQTAACKLHH